MERLFCGDKMKKKIGLFLGFGPGAGTFQYNQIVLDAVASLPKDEYCTVIGYRNPQWKCYLREYSILGAQQLPYHIGIRISDKLCTLLGLPVLVVQKIFQMIDPITKWLICQKCDLWIFPSQDSYSYLIPVPSLVAIHDLMHRYERRFPEVSFWGRYVWRERHYFNICARAKGVLVDSKLGRLQVHESYNMPYDKIHILPIIPPKYIRRLNLSLDVKNKYNLLYKYMFYPAHFSEHKNHQNLIKAVGLLKDKIHDLALVLVGSKANAYRSVIRLIDKLKLQNRIQILGYVPDEDMPGLYRHARAMIMPTYFGPTNIPPLEAISLGCPVGVSKIYAMPEQLGDAALYFNPFSVKEIASVIESLWKDDDLCNKLAKNGLHLASKLTQENFNNKLHMIIRTILSK